MDAATAKSLLAEIEETKEAGFSGLAGYLPSFGGNPTSPVGQQVQQYHNQQLQSDATKDILKALLLAGGLGAAARGASGLQSMFAENKKVSPKRVVEMPVPYPVAADEKEAASKPDTKNWKKVTNESEKKADNDLATSRYGLNYFLPSMLLGAPLAAYGGWKGVDALLNSQKRKDQDKELDEVKKEYEQALLGSYKKATDEALDSAFSVIDKEASPLGWARDVVNKYAPNLEGVSQGALLTAGLVSAPLGYMVVNNAMKKNSKRAILQKALAERARRQALAQPPEIYAVPKPEDMYKSAAPPASVTEGKPYVRPPELAPKQPGVSINPTTGMTRGTQEMLQRERISGMRAQPNFGGIKEKEPSMPDSVSDIRLRNFVHPAAPITEKHYPKAYNQLQQLKPHLEATDAWAARNLNVDNHTPDAATYNNTGHTTPGNRFYNAMTDANKYNYINLGNSIGGTATRIAGHPVTKGVNNALTQLATPKAIQPKPQPATPNLPAIPDTSPNIRRLGGGRIY
jgi:hypothetical protein